MAYTIVQNPGYSPMLGDVGNLRAATVDINISSYTNPGGEVLVPANFGMSRIIGLAAIVCPFGFVVNFTRSTNKLTIARDNGTATAAALPEITNGNNFGALSLLIVGA